jgi:hypothetical protein
VLDWSEGPRYAGRARWYPKRQSVCRRENSTLGDTVKGSQPGRHRGIHVQGRKANTAKWAESTRRQERDSTSERYSEAIHSIVLTTRSRHSLDNKMSPQRQREGHGARFVVSSAKESNGDAAGQ